MNNQLLNQNFRMNGRFGIFRKIVILAMLLTVIPLVTIGFYTLHTVDEAGQDISKRTTNALNQRTIDALEMQAYYIAESVRNFLLKVETDLQYLAKTNLSQERLALFAKQKTSQVWEAYSDVHSGKLPLYKEISVIDANGNERINIRNGQITPENRLRNVRSPENTTYLVEDYFAKTRDLPPGAIYVSRLAGFYISEPEHLQGFANPEEAIRNTKIHYDGVIRFATPLFTSGKFSGMVTLGLDHRHLMEFTQHVLPLSTEKVSFPIYNSGNYAFMFDDEGWIITHPKLWDIRGVDKNGRWIKAYSADTPKDLIDGGFVPFNLDTAGFIHENYPIVSNAVRQKERGTVITKNVGGVSKIMSYAPILYEKGAFSRHGIFGGITVGAEIYGFNEPAQFVENEILMTLALVRNRLWWIVGIAILITLVVSIILSHGFAKPIIHLTKVANQIANGSFKKRININREDEIGTLALSFNDMADKLDQNRFQLLSTISELRSSKTETETYANELEYQIKILQGIQRISNILGTTFNMNTVIRLILEHCINSIGFDRTILYLIDEQQQYLECTETHGFNAENEKYARRSRYHLERYDCIETRVVREGRIIYVEDFAHYPEATELDKKIYNFTKSNSFVYVPLKVKEKIIGILGADKVRSKNPITQTDINSLQILANQASRVIENTRLYQEVINQRNFVEDIISNMQNGVITINSNGRITSFNRAASKILQSGNPAMFNLNSQMSIETLSVIQEVKDKLFENGSYSNYNVKVETENGLKFLNILASLIKRNEPTNDGIIIIEDVTERKQLDDHVQQLERLASLGRFGASIAHEIRNPLTGVSLFLDNLHDRLAGQPDVANLVAKALEEIERLEKLTHEILVYTHPSAGELKLSNINDIISNVLGFIDTQFINNGIIVTKKLDDKLPDALINADRMRQALLNLFINAIQAMPDGGRLWVSTSLINKIPVLVQNAESIAANGWLKIRVQDNGPGIPPAERKKIFEPFYSKKQKGTGLGLATTYSIISAQNGVIRVGGKVGSGAIFTIYLPLTAETTGVMTG